VGGPTTGGDRSVEERQQGTEEEIEGVRGARGVGRVLLLLGMEGSCAKRELGVGEQGKEGARRCGQTEGKAEVEATTGIVLSSALLPQCYLTSLIHEGLHIQK
jgi:hypothetical protein